MKTFNASSGIEPDRHRLESISNDGVSKITSIKAQVKNENRVSIFLDGKYSFSLTLDQLLEQKLKKNDEISESVLKVLKKLSDEGKMRARLMEWLMGRPHSVRETRDYLYRKKVEKDFMESLIEQMLEKGYLDDYKFGIWFAENRQRKNKSSRAIRSELMSKGLSSEVINKIQGEMDSSDDSALLALINKLASRPRYQDKQKLTAYLIGRGFSYSQVKSAIESVSEY